MVITIDIGNTNIVIGGFVNEELRFVSRIRTDKYKTSDEYASLIFSVINLRNISKKIEGAVISSVVPSLSSVLKKAMIRLGANKTIIVSNGIKTGLNIKIDNPATLGSDMVASSVSAIEKYGAPFIMIDLGTATKIQAVDETGAFIGCSIMPGVMISLDALATRTAQLPSISLDGDVKVIGKNTIDSMRSGIILGTAGMIDSMCERYKEQLGENTKIIATGGISEDIVKHCKSEIILDKRIILEGLFKIYKLN